MTELKLMAIILNAQRTKMAIKQDNLDYANTLLDNILYDLKKEMVNYRKGG